MNVCMYIFMRGRRPMYLHKMYECMQTNHGVIVHKTVLHLSYL